MIIGLIGHKGSGKTFVANKIKTLLLPDANIYSFAFGIKEILRKLGLYKTYCKFTINNDDEIREIITVSLIHIMITIGIYDKSLNMLNINKLIKLIKNAYNANNQTYKFYWRKCAQFLGTQIGRFTIDSHIWIKYLDQITKNKQHFIIDDIRFPNELKFIKKHNNAITIGLKIPIDKDDKLLKHESEFYIDSIINNADIIVQNNYDKKTIDLILEQLSTRSVV